MDDVLKLMAEMVTDIQGFNVTHFGIFNNDERRDLQNIWINQARRNPNQFISLLSPAQKKIVTDWAIQRANYNTVQLIEVLEKFLVFLKSSTSPVYPKDGSKKSKSGLKSSLKKIIYKETKEPVFV